LARVPAPLTQHRLVVNGFVIDESDIGYNLSDLDQPRRLRQQWQSVIRTVSVTDQSGGSTAT
jgi:hypothetical protein